jgi:UDP-N-acetylglucosamine 1-carboxyvinyltransferase
MDKLVVEGGFELHGRVRISGSKNATLPILAACLMAEGTCRLEEVANLQDTHFMCEALKKLGVEVSPLQDGVLTTKVTDRTCWTAPYDLVRKMRGTICVLGPLVASRGHAVVSMPGGCNIGTRPIDLHLKGLRALGARVDVHAGYVEAEARRLRGREIFLGGAFGSSVLATANTLMAACLAEGTTVIESAACEPEIEDLANFLIAMGAKITGQGTPRLCIEGVTSLKGAAHKVIPDRIEAGTYMVAAAITRGQVQIENVRLDHMSAVVEKLREIGVSITPTGADRALVSAPKKLAATDVTTLPYPGIPTDMQAQLMALLALADGISVVTEKVFPDRFMHVAELNRLGASIRKEGSSAIIIGIPKFSAAPVMASDLRASASLVLAALAAKGRTDVLRIYHLDRGYEKIEEKLAALGAQVWREEQGAEAE